MSSIPWEVQLMHLGRAQMPWNECKPMDERIRSIARLLEGEKMAPLCREYCRLLRLPQLAELRQSALPQSRRLS